MAASFPNAKKTFSQIVNGVTKLVASIFNVNYDETEAIETFVGPTGGGAQSYSESLTNLLINYREGCRVDYKSAADLYVRAGAMMITDASGNRRLRRNTTDTTVTWADIDTGAEANSTVYYVYALADTNATTFTIKISTSTSAPSGATFYKKIGAFYNNASGNIVGITNLNLNGALKGHYESVWFAVSSNSAFTITHSLSTQRALAIIWWSSDSAGANAELDSYGLSGGSELGMQILAITSLDCVGRTGADGTHLQFAAGGSNNKTDGYMKVSLASFD